MEIKERTIGRTRIRIDYSLAEAQAIQDSILKRIGAYRDGGPEHGIDKSSEGSKH